jgi:phosphoglycolate phosphatase
VQTIFPEVAFKAIYGNKEGFPLKPDAALLQLIMEECDAVAETTVMIGDSGVDIQTAKNASVRSIGCSWGFRPRTELEEYHADTIIDTPLDLLTILR